MFVIEDLIHAERLPGKFESRAAAFAECRRLAEVPWDKPPNQAPCQSWQTCGRCYAIMEYDDSAIPWRLLSQENVLEISVSGNQWTTTRG